MENKHYCPDSRSCAKEFNRKYVANPIIVGTAGDYIYCKYQQRDCGETECREVVGLRWLMDIGYAKKAMEKGIWN